MTAIEQLVAGYHRFRRGYYEANCKQLNDLARQGQSPGVAVIACCDSRVDPAVITDSAPGDLFVIRNIANLVPPCEAEGSWHGTSAALQFAVCELQVEHLIVLGHARCGGIRSLLSTHTYGAEDKFIASWMSIVEEARQRTLAQAGLQTLDEQARACERGAIEISLANLQTFPWIRENVIQGRLQLHGWYYDISCGELLRFDAGSGCFVGV